MILPMKSDCQMILFKEKLKGDFLFLNRISKLKWDERICSGKNWDVE